MLMETIEKEFNTFQNKNTYWHALQDGTMDAFDRAYESAVEKLRSEVLGIEIPLVIDGKEVRTDDWVEMRSPTDKNIVVSRYPAATVDHAKQAIDAAKAGAEAWARVPWQERADIIDKAADLFTRDFYELCAIMTMEAGKTRYESSIDVDEAIDFLRFYAMTMREMNGYEMQMGSPVPQENCRSVLKPYGAWAVVCPFNFPVAITTGMTSAALLTGNTAILKPSPKGILSGWKCYSLLKEAGIPDHALHFIVGDKKHAVAKELTSNAKIDGIVFTGSKNVGFKVQKAIAERDPGIPVIAEMGGKNAIIVTKNADLDKAVEGVYKSAFGFQGQKCSACSRILVEEDIADEFLERLTKMTKETKVMEPWNKEAYMGPIIEEAKVEEYKQNVALAMKDGKILAGGKVMEGKNGNYVLPTLVDGLPRDHELFQRELFMPFVAAWRFKGLDEALELANNVQFGLTGGIFTEDEEEAETFFDRIQVGVAYHNRRMGGSTAAVVNGQSFGGWKHSGSTGRGAGGRYYLPQFMREQSQTRVVD